MTDAAQLGHAKREHVTELVYVGDPMCSWCWGFAPVLDRLSERFELPVRTIVGGLRPGPDARALDDELRAFLRDEWPTIAARTGQPFDLAFLDRDTFLYDTELPAIAVVIVRALVPERTLEYFTAIQRSFYAEGVDVTDPAELARLAETVGADDGEFRKQMASVAAKDRAWQDFASARELGTSAFPTLFARVGTRLVLITQGYVSFESVEKPLADWLATG